MSRPPNSLRFAKKRLLNLAVNSEQFRTPLLVPSYSSKGFPEVGHILELTQQFVDSQILVSAYDLHYGHISEETDLNFPPLLIVDSGGYEASQDRAMQDPERVSVVDYQPVEWSEALHNGIVESWDVLPPTIFVSYDHPSKRIPLDEQIANALKFGSGNGQINRELLLKPSTTTSHYLKVEEICANARKFAPFVAIGVTEDEIGKNLLERMLNIGKIRQALTSASLETPIHVFGSLDTITTLLYFVMGADVFDGLTWLRYGYYDGATVYKQNLAALKFAPKTHVKRVDQECWHHNYLYLQEMQQRMRSFLNDGDFAKFKDYSTEIEELFEAAVEEIGD